MPLNWKKVQFQMFIKMLKSMYHYLEIFPWFLSLSLQSLHLLFLSENVDFSHCRKQYIIVLSNGKFCEFSSTYTIQMIDWIVTKFLIIAQDVIKLHSNKNFNVFSLGILKCVSFWRRHIFYQKVFICPSMMHKHIMVLKKLGREQGIFF